MVLNPQLKWPQQAHNELMSRSDRLSVVDGQSCNLLLSVSNQSYLDDPVVITIEIDGVQVVSESFEVRNQHHSVRFPLQLGLGPHVVHVTTDMGVTIDERFALQEGPRSHASVSYYNYADEDGKPIDWHIQFTPMGTR